MEHYATVQLWSFKVKGTRRVKAIRRIYIRMTIVFICPSVSERKSWRRRRQMTNGYDIYSKVLWFL